MNHTPYTMRTKATQVLHGGHTTHTNVTRVFVEHSCNIRMTSVRMRKIERIVHEGSTMQVHEDDTKSYELHEYDTIYTDRVRTEYESHK